MAEEDRLQLEVNEFEREFQRPLTRPETEEGMGSTLGGNVGVEHQRDEDRRNGATGPSQDVERV